MDTNTTPQTDAWERWDWIWQAVFYAGFAGSLGLLAIRGGVPITLWEPALLTVLVLAWHWAGMRWAYSDPERWEARAPLRFGVLLIDGLLWFMLVSISPTYYLALFGLFAQVFRHLPGRYAVAGAVFLSVGVVIEQSGRDAVGFSLTDPGLILFALLALGGTLIGIWVSAIIAQSTQRRELIERLEAAQAELAAAERREGILQERQRLAGEIHDTLAQGFTSIVMLIEASEQAIANRDELSAGRSLTLAGDTARDSLEQARRLVWELRPEALEDAGLPDALARVCRKWGERAGLLPAFNTTGAPVGLHPELEITLLRALQEALHNIEKHARASEVNVTLSYLPDALILDVTDDGAGFDQGLPVADGHFGLQTMRARVEKLGGSVLIESEVGSGTALAVEVPTQEDL